LAGAKATRMRTAKFLAIVLAKALPLAVRFGYAYGILKLNGYGPSD
jgi:hypothetical protein